MKRIVLVEDNPWKAKNQIIKMQEEGICVEAVLFFTPLERQQLDSQVEEKLKDFEDAVQKKVRLVWNPEFNQVMDEYYGNDDLVFFMDLGLIGDGSRVFSERINIIYARSKGEDGKIWFYTVGARDQKALLYDNFPHRIIDANSHDGQLTWNMEQIHRILEDGH